MYARVFIVVHLKYYTIVLNDIISTFMDYSFVFQLQNSYEVFFILRNVC